MTTRNEMELKAFVLDYLQNREAPIFENKMRVFDPTTAFILNWQVKIPRILLQLSVTDPSARLKYLKENNLTVQNGGKSKFNEI